MVINMSIHEITTKVNELASNWEQFKVLNDQRLQTLEKKNTVDPITLSQMEKLNNLIDGYQDKISKIEVASLRPYSELENPRSASVDQEYKKAFVNYLRKGNESTLATLEKKTLSVGNNAEGGYLVTHQMSNAMIRAIFETSPMRQLANITSISSDALEIIEDYDEAYAGWTHETETRTETKTPQINKKVIMVHEIYAQPKATQKLVDDASIDIETWLAEKIVDVFSRKENAAFINGDGIGKPKGILSYLNGIKWNEVEQITSGENGAITSEGIFKLYYSLKEIHAVKAKFLMSRAAVQALRMLKDTRSGKYLWQPSLEAGTPDSLLGAEVVQSPDMPGLTQGALAIAFADFRAAYQIVDRQGIRVLRDPFTDKPFVKFYTTKRVGGDVTNFQAIKLLNLVQ
jgi:HK97 family phage major capsid protein